MKRLLFIILILLLLSSAVLYRLARSLPDGIYAEMDTSRGRIVFRLHHDRAPMTVANFVALAEGSNGLVSGDRKGAPFYDGLTFHKVIPEVMIQGGDPRGTGNGSPGFRFRREFHPDLRHDRPGILSMLNEGAFSHGSQFFIALNPAPRYDDKHSVFGEVVKGQEVVARLEEGDILRGVSIVRQGKDASAFDIPSHLKALEASAREAQAEAMRAAREKAELPHKPRKRVGLPGLTGKTDPARVPAASQPEKEKIALEYLLVSHKDALPRTGKPTRGKPEARQMAVQLVALAREEGANFVELADKFSDSPDHRIPLLVRDNQTTESILPCFRLKPGQVSDPIDTPKGFMVFRAVELDLIQVRHILISYEGAQGSKQTRSRQEAKELAERVLAKARQGDDFADLAREYSDSSSAEQGGLIGEIARGTTVPAFDHAAFSLDVNEISKVTSSPSGYQIIQRTQ